MPKYNGICSVLIVLMLLATSSVIMILFLIHQYNVAFRRAPKLMRKVEINSFFQRIPSLEKWTSSHNPQFYSIQFCALLLFKKLYKFSLFFQFFMIVVIVFPLKSIEKKNMIIPLCRNIFFLFFTYWLGYSNIGSPSPHHTIIDIIFNI